MSDLSLLASMVAFEHPITDRKQALGHYIKQYSQLFNSESDAVTDRYKEK